MALRALPAVKGSAHCPFCSGSVPRAKLSVHLLRCKKIRNSAQNVRRGEAESTRFRSGDSNATTTAITSTANAHNNDGYNTSSVVGAANRGVTRKVQCPHCLRGFSPSVAPTHISICARVENRPKSAAAAGVMATHKDATGTRAGLDGPASFSIGGSRRMQPEKARIMPPFY